MNQKLPLFRKFIRATLTLFLLQFFPFFSAHSQVAPKREVRGVWIATVLNIDYPSAPSTDEFTLKQQWTELLNKHKALGINVLYVQVRSAGDAFYKSKLAPWSYYLTGKSGLPPANNYDPLPFMIETAHSMGFEFHAWLNPYRMSMDDQEPSFFDENHVMRQHPEWCIKYGRRYIMNPGLPEVRAHVNAVVEEIVKNYNVDGIHFDDYFYPYKIAGRPFPDAETFNKYNDGFSNLEDWRRHNIDLLVYGLSKMIKKIKPRCQFGISPFGVWRNGNVDKEGTDTQAGLTCYDDLYADVRKWLRDDWIDYVIPQIYWHIGHPKADHERIARWWSANSAGHPVYIGHGAYRIGENKDWADPAEMGRQIRLSRSLKNVKGSVYFSSKSLISNLLGFSDTLKNNYYQYPALPIQVLVDTSLLECMPPEMREIVAENGQVRIRWKASPATPKRMPFQYCVYRFENGKVDFTNAKNILTIVSQDAKELTFVDKNVVNENAYTYAVTVVDSQKHETPAEDIYAIGESKAQKDKLPAPPTPSVKKPVEKKRGFWAWLFGCKKK